MANHLRNVSVVDEWVQGVVKTASLLEFKYVRFLFSDMKCDEIGGKNATRSWHSEARIQQKMSNTLTNSSQKTTTTKNNKKRNIQINK